MRKPSIVSCRAIAQLPPDLREHPLVLLVISAYDPAFVQSVTGVRNALDKRLHNAIFGDALHAERVLKQFSYIRTGKLANINLLHLIDKDGGFKYDDPLASFATFSAKDAGIHFRDAFERLSQCINIATPSLGPAAQRFLPALKTVVVEHIDLGVEMKQISKYYASVMQKVSQPTRAWSVGSADGSRLATFNIDWIEQATKIHRQLNQAAQAKRAKDEVTLAMASRKRHDVEDVDDDKGSRSRSPSGSASHRRGRARHTATSHDSRTPSPADSSDSERYNLGHWDLNHSDSDESISGTFDEEDDY